MTGDRIKQYLDRKGIKQVYVAEKAGIHEKRLSALLTGRVRLQIEDLQKISQVLDVPPTYFLRDETEVDQ